MFEYFRSLIASHQTEKFVAEFKPHEHANLVAAGVN